MVSGAEKVERWVVQRDAPVFRRNALEPDFLLRRGAVPSAVVLPPVHRVSWIDARHCRSYECCGKDVRFILNTSGDLCRHAATRRGHSRLTKSKTLVDSEPINSIQIQEFIEGKIG